MRIYTDPLKHSTCSDLLNKPEATEGQQWEHTVVAFSHLLLSDVLSRKLIVTQLPCLPLYGTHFTPALMPTSARGRISLLAKCFYAYKEFWGGIFIPLLLYFVTPAGTTDHRYEITTNPQLNNLLDKNAPFFLLCSSPKHKTNVSFNTRLSTQIISPV